MNLIVSSTQHQNIIISKPGVNDVLCGRGHASRQLIFPGNRYFRSLIEKYCLQYKVEVLNTRKSKIVLDVIAAIHSLKPPGRFVTKDPTTDMFTELEMKKVTRKVSEI